MSRIGVWLPLLCATVLASQAEQWPSWRGPAGTGISAEKNPPLHWSTNQNISWRVVLPDRGNSTPVVWDRELFITQALPKENRLSVMCFDTRNGSLVWEYGATNTQKTVSYESNGECSSSPVVDGKRVIAWFGSAGILCLDTNGRELWRRDLGKQTHEWGYGSSPVLYRDMCLLNFGPGARSFVIALEKKTGKTVWQLDLPRIPAGAKWEDFGGQTRADAPGAATVSEIAGSWATPLLIRTGRREELILTLPLQVMALAPRSGQRLWSCEGPSIGAYSSPFFGDGIVGLTASGLQNVALAARPGGNGDVTASHRLWFQKLPDSKACIGSGVIFKGHMYFVTTAGFAHCLDLITGRTIWEQRLTGSGARNGCWSSPVVANGLLYVANQNADVFVLRAGPTFECVATNSIGGEPMNACLALSDGAFYLRTDKALWCVANGRR